MGPQRGGCEASEKAEQTPGERRRHNQRFSKITEGGFPGPLVLKIHFSKSGASEKYGTDGRFLISGMLTGRLETQSEFYIIEEPFRNYHRDDGQLVLLSTHTEIKQFFTCQEHLIFYVP